MSDAKAFLDGILNPIEQDVVAQFASNPTMVEAVKKILLAGVYFNGTLRAGEVSNPTRNFMLTMSDMGGKTFSNEELGANMRAAARGIGYLEQGFAQIDLYKHTPEKEGKDVNPAR